MFKLLIPVMFVLLASGCTPADLKMAQDVFQAAGAGNGALTEADITAGLKEALVTGTQRSVSRIGKTDGFWQAPALRIPLPESLRKTEKLLRTLGQGKTVDEFHLSLNRAAEQAVPEAASIFGAAIRQMTLEDARAILRGPDDAATRYFRAKTTAALTTRFRPIVSKTTAAVGVTRRYKELSARAEKLVPGYSPTDIDAYVTDRALAGLFTTLAEEEKQIRHDPAARTTELLKKVFGGP